ncbi:hypothetical protein CPJ18_02680 [Agrobacterium rosae]|uniref:Uncharacterized protein n=1 Tax=Agrobacterium rosae TaxID=1972867 RepID=A0AAE5S2B9_9HYPH|nr:hypothetical protein CPJ18_02680 [Agrobacterium rosae]
MQRREINKKFDEWWETQNEFTARDRHKARRMFAVACTHVVKPQSYRFQSGRWIVTVQARTEDDAKVMALAKLNERARKFMTKTPPGGWGIRRIDGDEIAPTV